MAMNLWLKYLACIVCGYEGGGLYGRLLVKPRLSVRELWICYSPRNPQQTGNQTAISTIMTTAGKMPGRIECLVS